MLVLEFLRRLGKEYDRRILRAHLAKAAVSTATPSSSTDHGKDGVNVFAQRVAATRFRPSVFQQAVRALLHMLAFAVAYFIML